jgi:hypothetical protein
MNTIKNMIRKWLLDSQPEEATKMRGLSVGLVEERPSTTPVRTFTVSEAMNGTYITFQRRKYNPNGPDEYRHEMYIVRPDESLIDAISTVLVLTEK